MQILIFRHYHFLNYLIEREKFFLCPESNLGFQFYILTLQQLSFTRIINRPNNSFSYILTNSYFCMSVYEHTLHIHDRNLHLEFVHNMLAQTHSLCVQVTYIIALTIIHKSLGYVNCFNIGRLLEVPHIQYELMCNQSTLLSFE